MGHRRLSTIATIVGPSAVSGRAFSRKWRLSRSRRAFHRRQPCQGAPLGGCFKKGEFAEAIGRSRGGRTSKIHALADDRGRPVAFALTPGKPRGDDRTVLSGILHELKTGCRWRDVPPAYGPPTTLYNRSNRWSQRRIWQRIFAKMAAAGPVPTSFPSPAAMSRRTARRPVQKGGVRSDGPFARRKNEQNPCLGR